MTLIVQDKKIESLKHFYLLEHDDVILMLQLINHYNNRLHFNDMVNMLMKGMQKERNYIVALLNRMAVTDLVLFDADSKSYSVTKLGIQYLWEGYKNV